MSTAFDRRVERLRKHVLSHDEGAGKTENTTPPENLDEKDLLPELTPELEAWRADLENMTVDELKELAGVLEVEVPSKARKAEILAILVKSKIEEEDPENEVDPENETD